jgi:hypothetical protein
MELSIEEKELVVRGLNMQKNYIETHDIILSARDAMNMGKKDIIRPISSEQYRRIIALEDLIKKIA